MNNQNISEAEAREIVLNSQFLRDNNKIPKSTKGTFRILDELGYIQIDTISVINRAHHHTLWTRNENYSFQHLHDLQAKQKTIFEYWTHAMSYVPMKDYRFVLHRMKNFNKPKSNWLKYRYNQSKKYFKPVLERIYNEGMLSSSDFENTSGRKGGTWWEWKPVKTALEYLFWRGDLMVAERRGFQKYYDLTERVLPGSIDASLPDTGELNRFFILRALSSLGIASEKEIQKYMQPGKVDVSDLQVTRRKDMLKAIRDMSEAGEIVPVLIGNNKKQINYTLPDKLDNIGRRKNMKKVHILSPFDNLIIQRERTKRLFNFDYTIECYLPENKRKYGYFVTPILWGNKFIARMDSKAERKTGKFIINNIVFESSFGEYDEFIPQFTNKLKEFIKFNECDRLIIKKCSPVKVKKLLMVK